MKGGRRRTRGETKLNKSIYIKKGKKEENIVMMTTMIGGRGRGGGKGEEEDIVRKRENEGDNLIVKTNIHKENQINIKRGGEIFQNKVR